MKLPERLSDRLQSPSLESTLGRLASRINQREQDDVRAAGRTALYDLAVQQVVSDYQDVHQDYYESTWLQLMQRLEQAPLSSIGLEHDQHGYGGIHLPRRAAFTFDQLTTHNGVDLRLHTSLMTMQNSGSLRHLTGGPQPNNRLGEYQLLQDGLAHLRQGVTKYSSDTKPHTIHHVSSRRIGMFRHIVTTQAIAERGKQIALDASDFIVAQVTAEPLVGGESKLITRAIVGRSDFDPSLYAGNLPTYHEAEKEVGLPRNDAAITLAALRKLPRLMPDRTKSYAKMQTVLEVLAHSESTELSGGFFVHSSNNAALIAEFNADRCAVGSDSYGYCRGCRVSPAT